MILLVINRNNNRCYRQGRNKKPEWVPVGAIVKRSVPVVSIRIIPTMAIIVAIGVMVIHANVLVYPDVFTIININIDVFVTALDVGSVSRILNRFVATFYA